MPRMQASVITTGTGRELPFSGCRDEMRCRVYAQMAGLRPGDRVALPQAYLRCACAPSRLLSLGGCLLNTRFQAPSVQVFGPHR